MRCSVASSLRQVFVLVLFVCVYNVPRFFERDISCVDDVKDSVTSSSPARVHDDDADCHGGVLLDNNAYQIVYENALYCLVVYLGPFSLLVFFNVRLVSELVRSRRRSTAAGAGGGEVASTEDRRERNNITLVRNL